MPAASLLSGGYASVGSLYNPARALTLPVARGGWLALSCGHAAARHREPHTLRRTLAEDARQAGECVRRVVDEPERRGVSRSLLFYEQKTNKRAVFLFL